MLLCLLDIFSSKLKQGINRSFCDLDQKESTGSKPDVTTVYRKYWLIKAVLKGGSLKFGVLGHVFEDSIITRKL